MFQLRDKENLLEIRLTGSLSVVQEVEERGLMHLSANQCSDKRRKSLSADLARIHLIKPVGNSDRVIFDSVRGAIGVLEVDSSRQAVELLENSIIVFEFFTFKRDWRVVTNTTIWKKSECSLQQL